MNYPNEPLNQTVTTDDNGKSANHEINSTAPPVQNGQQYTGPYPPFVPPAGVVPPWMPNGGYPYPPHGYPLFDPYRMQRKSMRSAVNKAGLVLIACLFIMLAVSTVFVMVAQVFLAGDLLNNRGDYESILYWMQAFLSPVALLIPAFIFFKGSRLSMTEVVKTEKGNVFFKLCLILTSIGVAMFANLPAGALKNLLSNIGIQTAEGSLPSQMSAEVVIPHILAIVVIAPLVEEFVFRGVILTYLEKHHGQLFAVLTSGVLFGLMHGDIISVLVTSAAGIVFGLTYVKTRNLWVTVVIHFLYNSLAVLSSYADILFIEEAAALIVSLTFLVPVILGLIGIIVLLIKYRSKLWENNKRKQPVTDGVAYQPTALIPVTVSRIAGSWFTSISFWITILYVCYNLIAVNIGLG